MHNSLKIVNLLLNKNEEKYDYYNQVLEFLYGLLTFVGSLFLISLAILCFQIFSEIEISHLLSPIFLGMGIIFFIISVSGFISCVSLLSNKSSYTYEKNYTVFYNLLFSKEFFLFYLLKYFVLFCLYWFFRKISFSQERIIFNSNAYIRFLFFKSKLNLNELISLNTKFKSRSFEFYISKYIYEYEIYTKEYYIVAKLIDSNYIRVKFLQLATYEYNQLIKNIKKQRQIELKNKINNFS